MALINRFSRLFRADLHAVLDRIEEPTLLLKQAVREMAEDVAEDEKNLKIIRFEQEQGPVLQAEVDAALKEIQHEIDLCLDSKNEKLARSVIKRKLELQQRAKRIKQKADGLASELASLTERLETNRNRLAAMQQKLEILEEDQANRSNQSTVYDVDVSISEDDIEVALLREKQARSGS